MESNLNMRRLANFVWVFFTCGSLVVFSMTRDFSRAAARAQGYAATDSASISTVSKSNSNILGITGATSAPSELSLEKAPAALQIVSR